MSKFKLGILIVFGLFIVIGVIVFASSKNTNNTFSANLVMWGTINQSTANDFLSRFDFDSKKELTVTYIQKKPENFGTELAEAIADGNGPDILLLPSDIIFKQKNRILEIPYKSYPERTYKDTFIETSEIFLNKNGILALPVLIDPLVMYWNRDIFREKLKTSPPLHWEEFQNIAPEFVEKDNLGNIRKTFVSFGEWRNVSNSKEILSNLFLQVGNNIVSKNELGLQSDLLENKGQNTTPAISAVTFYTQFANPTQKTYSWNRSMPKSQEFFLSGDMAIYFGLASELSSIRSKNPNLNFDLALVPQTKTGQSKVFARLYGLSILKSSKFIPHSFQAINIMTSGQQITALEEITGLPPVRKDLLSKIPTDSYKSVFYKSAIWSKNFIDTDGQTTNSIFQNMIESITSGRSSIYEAVSGANDSLNDLLSKYGK